MPGKLRKGAVEGAYILTGSLADLGGPGRRRVRSLEIRGISRADADCLKYLENFQDLEELELQRIDGTDLSPLAGRELTALRLVQASRIDLAPIADLRVVTRLALMEITGCRIPDPFVLQPTLTKLSLWGTPGDGAADIEMLIRNIDWSRHSGLTSLTVRGGYGVTGISPDLLRHLPNLEWLEWKADVPDTPSPLRPPFDGLSRKLEGVKYRVEGAAHVREQLLAYLRPTVPTASASVYDPVRFQATSDNEEADVVAGPWKAWRSDDAASSSWGVYYSLADLWEPKFEIEHDALQNAIRLLKQADRKRAKKIDFDQEADGTGISAAELEDLEWALDVLGIPKEA